MTVSNDTVSEVDGTGVGQNALPASTGSGGVSCSSDPGAVPSSEALPLSVQPPLTGGGTTVPFEAWPVPVNVTVCSTDPGWSELSTQVSLNAPTPGGVNATCNVTDCPA